VREQLKCTDKTFKGEWTLQIIWRKCILKISGSTKFNIHMNSNRQHKGVTCSNHNLKNDSSKKLFFSMYRDRFEPVDRPLAFTAFPELTRHKATSYPPATAVSTNTPWSTAHEQELFNKRQYRAVWLCGDSREDKLEESFVSTTHWTGRDVHLSQPLKYTLWYPRSTQEHGTEVLVFFHSLSS